MLPNWLHVWTHDELVQLQQQDLCIGEILRLKQLYTDKPKKSEIQQVHKDLITLWHQWEILKVYNDLLYREIEDDLASNQLHLLAPREMRDTTFTHLHEQRYAGHLGRDRTITAIKKRFYWPGMSEDVARWCQECQLCARRKRGPGKGKSALEQFKVFQPMSVMAVDILGPLTKTNSSNEYIIVCGCYFTKWKEAFAVPNHTAATVADKLVQEVFLHFIDESKKCPNNPTGTYCKCSRPLPYSYPNCRTPRNWKFTQDHRTTRPPLANVKQRNQLSVTSHGGTSS